MCAGLRASHLNEGIAWILAFVGTQCLEIEILRVLTLGLCLGSSNDDTKIRVLPWIVAIIVGLADI